MLRVILSTLVFAGGMSALQAGSSLYAQSPQRTPAVLVIHGGSGSITRDNVPPEREAEYRAAMEEALRAGHRVIGEGGSSLDAVIAAITVMEDSPLFNAGKGAVFTSAGTNELDASIMEGRMRRAGAVASLKHIRDPITLARAVLEDSRHVMMVGEGAEAFAKGLGFEMVPNEYFSTPRRLEQYERARDEEERKREAGELGTVGAVAVDRNGDLAAGTSTGGTSYKRWGRVGDSPIIGAGTYADNESCGISATGDGEYFIRGVVAHDISAMMRYGRMSLRGAAEVVIHDKLEKMGGRGGVIGLDRDGNVAMTFNTEGMFRGYIDRDGNVDIRIFRD
jgi:beta-aspartyl-peptidase (threonine type)